MPKAIQRLVRAVPMKTRAFSTTPYYVQQSIFNPHHVNALSLNTNKSVGTDVMKTMIQGAEVDFVCTGVSGIEHEVIDIGKEGENIEINVVGGVFCSATQCTYSGSEFAFVSVQGNVENTKIQKKVNDVCGGSTTKMFIVDNVSNY